MSKQDIILGLQQTLSEVRKYNSDLKNRHDAALQSLADLSAGFGVVPASWADTTSWDAAMRHLAAASMLKISKMPLRIVY